MRGEFIDLAGSRMYYYAAGTRGAGEPIVFLHGFPTSSHLWQEVVPLCPTGHRLVVLDLLGYGRSDPPKGKPVSIKAHAERIIAMLDFLQINYACVVGHDLGGGIALAMALKAPARVSRLCLIDTVAFDAWPTREAKMARAMLPLTRYLPPTWMTGVMRTDLLRGYLEHERGSHSIERYVKPFSSIEGRAALVEHVLALDSAETTTMTPRLKDVVAPTAIVWGSEDPFLPADVGERVQAAIPHATMEMIPGMRHFAPEEAPERVAAVITELMAR